MWKEPSKITYLSKLITNFIFLEVTRPLIIIPLHTERNSETDVLREHA